MVPQDALSDFRVVTIGAAPLGAAEGQEALAGLPARRLVTGSTLRWESIDSPAVLDLVVACDLRAPCRLQVVDEAGWQVEVDAGFASHAQHLRLALPPGLGALRVSALSEDAGDLWVVDDPALPVRVVAAQASPALRRERALQRLCDDALCQFSWMGGCVLEGHAALHRAFPDQGWADARQRWLAPFLSGGRLHYQAPRGERIEDRFTNIEATLPVAGFAAEDPGAPICDLALAMWREHRQADGLIADFSATAEGSYTVAYPLAVIATGRADAPLRAEAVQQLRLRRERLIHGGDCFLRHHPQHGHSFRNWARGICWYLLGLARSLETLGIAADADLSAHLGERCCWIIGRQRVDGLWDNFLDEARRPPDSSGSSGIATALLVAHRLGVVDRTAVDAARRCWSGLENLLEPDGWLGSVAPNNKRGEAEQHGTRRSVEPFALGLYGQLAAELRLAGA